jgi:hypothetical protein
MDIVIRSVLLILGMGIVVQTARPHFRYGEWLDPSSTVEIFNVSIPFGMAAIVALLHVGKGMMPAAAAMYWRRSQFILCALAILLFPLLVAVSVTSTLAFLDLQRGERATVAETKLKRDADLRAELAATEARLLKNTGWWRPAAVVESEIAAERRSLLWSGTDACSDATTRQQQRYCSLLDRLAGELAAAKEADTDRRREKEIRAELLDMKATSRSAHPDLDFLSRALEVSLERAGFWRTVLFAAVIEAAEALFILFGTAPANKEQRRDRNRRRVIGLRSLCRGALVWAKGRGRERTDKSAPRSQDAEPAGSAQAQHISRAAAAGATPRPKKNSCALTHPHCPIRSEIRVEVPTPTGAVAITPKGAVDAFVAECPREPDARVAGSVMFAAYVKLHLSRGWPPLSPAVFGRHLKAAVTRAGGRKVKANAQTYIGLALPPGS